jgi:ribonuclease HII
MLIGGIDENGRGALIGPMMICGIVIRKQDEQRLRELGVRESKLLSARQREELFPELKRVARHLITLRVPARRIDELRSKGVKLDAIEAMKFAHIINTLPARRFYIDAPGINPSRFELMLRSHLKREVELVVENFADRRYVVVAAASIIGKVLRDREIRRIERKLGLEVGVGYAHDPRTIALVKRLLRERKRLPSWVRQSWATIKQLREEMSKKTIRDFVG